MTVPFGGPDMTRTRTAAIGLALAMALALGACTANAPVQLRAAPAGWEDEMLGAINAHRANVGLPPLSWCSTLAGAAQRQSQAQADRNDMFHSNLVANATGAGYTGWTALAENVAEGQPSVGAVMTTWMNSPGHRANILGRYTDVGFGQARGSNGALYWTQSFGSGGRC
jgi:uncharacterized protein YkwD